MLIGHDEFVVLSEQAPAVESHRTPLRDARRANRLRTRIEHGDVVVGKDRIVERRRQNDVDQRFALQFYFFVARNVCLSEAFDGLLEEGLIGNISVGKDTSQRTSTFDCSKLMTVFSGVSVRNLTT